MKLFFKIKLLIQSENLLEAFCDMFKIERWHPSIYKNADGSYNLIKARQVGATHLGNHLLFIDAITAIEIKYKDNINSFNIDWSRFNVLKAFA